MASRLTSLANAFSASYPANNSEHGESNSNGSLPVQLPTFNNENELADFNRFMVELGQQAATAGVDQAGSSVEPSPARRSVQLGSAPSPYSSNSPASDMTGSDLFDATALAQLGLGGMPGINQAHKGEGQSAISFGGSMYPTLDRSQHHRSNSQSSSHSSQQGRQIAPLPNPAGRKPNANGGDQPTSYPSLSNLNLPSGISPRSTGEPAQMLYGDFNFDMLAKSGSSLPDPSILPMSSNHNKYRNVDLLGRSAYSAVAPRGSLDLLSEACEEAGLSRLLPGEGSAPAGVTYDEPVDMEDTATQKGDSPPILQHSLLSEKDAGSEFKLPALRHIAQATTKPRLLSIATLSGRSDTAHRSRRQDSFESTSSRPSTAFNTPGLSPRLLPREDHEGLALQVDGMGLDAHHTHGSKSNAVFIRDLLVMVNDEWKRKQRASRKSIETAVKEEHEEMELTPSSPKDVKMGFASPTTPKSRTLAGRRLEDIAAE